MSFESALDCVVVMMIMMMVMMVLMMVMMVVYINYDRIVENSWPACLCLWLQQLTTIRNRGGRRDVPPTTTPTRPTVLVATVYQLNIS